MEVVRKDYYQYQTAVEQQKLQQPNKQKKQAKKSYRLEKVMAALSISVFLLLSIFLLLRYAAITEAKHRVIKLTTQLEQVEKQRDKLTIELEKVSKSNWIEVEAQNRLNMKYPSSSQTNYITINPTKVALLTNEMNKQLSLDSNEITNEGSVINKMLNKFVGLFKI